MEGGGGGIGCRTSGDATWKTTRIHNTALGLAVAESARATPARCLVDVRPAAL